MGHRRSPFITSSRAVTCRLTSRSTRTLLGGPTARPSSRRLAWFVRRHRMHDRARNPFLAAVLGVFAPGLGHVYVGRARRFGIAAVAVLGLFLALGVGGALS